MLVSSPPKWWMGVKPPDVQLRAPFWIIRILGSYRKLIGELVDWFPVWNSNEVGMRFLNFITYRNTITSNHKISQVNRKKKFQFSDFDRIQIVMANLIKLGAWQLSTPPIILSAIAVWRMDNLWVLPESTFFIPQSFFLLKTDYRH